MRRQPSQPRGKADICARRTNDGGGKKGKGARTGNDYARSEKSLMEIVPLSSNLPEIPWDVTAFKIPPCWKMARIAPAAA